MKRIPAFTVLLLMAVAALTGASVIPLLNVQYAPAGTTQSLSVSFDWPDVSDRIMESQVTSRLEGVLSGIEGCVCVSSLSSKGRGSISLDFSKETDMASVRFEVASRIRNVYSSLPDGVSYPVISLDMRGGSSSTALTYLIKSPLPSNEIEKYITGHVILPVSSVDGVEKVSFWGATPFELEIIFDSKAAEAYGISAEDISAAFSLRYASDVLGMAEYEGETMTFTIACRHSDDIGQMPVVVRNGRIIRLHEIATWSYVESRPTSYYRLNGLNTVSLSVNAAPGKSLLTTVGQVKEVMSELQNVFPPEITASLSYDSSEYIVSELNKIYIRTIVCVLILLVFVYAVSRSWRYLFVVFSTLVVNILISVVFYRIFNLPVHIYTLAGITVSLGIVIDTSIVMADHYSCFRNRSVFPALLGATFTTIGALCVIILLPENEKANLEDFAKVIMINLSVALFSAYFFIPSLLDSFPVSSGGQASRGMRRRRRITGLRNAYCSYIRWGAAHRWVYLAVLVMAFGIPLFLLPDKVAENVPEKDRTFLQNAYNSVMSWKPYMNNRRTVDMVAGSSFAMFHKAMEHSDFYRQPGRNMLYIFAAMPEGCTVVQLNDVVRNMENYLSLFDEIESFSTNIYSYDNARIDVAFKPEYEGTSFPAELKSKVISMASDFGGAVWRVWGVNESYFNNSIVPNYRTHRIRLVGYSYPDLYEYAEQLVEYLSGHRRVSLPEILTPDGRLADNEFNLNYDFGQIAGMGVSPYGYYRKLNSILFDTRLPALELSGEFTPVVLRSDTKDSFDLWHVLNSEVTVDSVAVRLSEIGSIRKQRTAMPIFRRNQSYEMMVGFDFIGSYELARSYIGKTVSHFNDEVLPVGYKVEQVGSGWMGWKTKMRYLSLVLLVIAIIYVMCGITFNSFRYPLAIILMIPVSFIGVFLMFGLSDVTFDQGGFAAFVMLCGIVVNAGIYIVNDFINALKKPGENQIKAYVRAFGHKIRPIMLTVASTVLGLIPFLFDGPEEVFWFAFAAGVCSGLLFSLVALLFFLPVFAIRKTPRP